MRGRCTALIGGCAVAFTIAYFVAPAAGPNAEAADVTPQAFDPDDGVALFLRAAHETACKRFGTVLGPEANEAHRNHFHLDMAKRRYGNYCE